MAHRIGWSRRALRDLEAIAGYIAADSPTYAGRGQENRGRNQDVGEVSASGRKVPEFDDENVRELIVYSYRLIYQLQHDEVVIAAVIHGKRLLQ